MSYTYPTIKTVAVTTRAKGGSDTATLQTMFPTSPGTVSGDQPTASPVDYKEAALALLLDGVIEENLQVGTFDRDYSSHDDVPDYAGGKGAVPADGYAPASSWVPNPTSPGAGSVDPKQQPAAPAGFGLTPTNGSHAGISVDVTAPSRNPATASKNMSTRTTTADFGKSPATQNAS